MSQRPTLSTSLPSLAYVEPCASLGFSFTTCNPQGKNEAAIKERDRSEDFLFLWGCFLALRTSLQGHLQERRDAASLFPACQVHILRPSRWISLSASCHSVYTTFYKTLWIWFTCDRWTPTLSNSVWFLPRPLPHLSHSWKLSPVLPELIASSQQVPCPWSTPCTFLA